MSTRTIPQQHLDSLDRYLSLLEHGRGLSPHTIRNYRSDITAFLLKVSDADGFNAKAREGGYLLRRIPDEPGLESCVRVTLGTPEQNDGLLKVLESSK